MPTETAARFSPSPALPRGILRGLLRAVLGLALLGPSALAWSATPGKILAPQTKLAIPNTYKVVVPDESVIAQILPKISTRWAGDKQSFAASLSRVCAKRGIQPELAMAFLQRETRFGLLLNSAGKGDPEKQKNGSTFWFGFGLGQVDYRSHASWLKLTDGRTPLWQIPEENLDKSVEILLDGLTELDHLKLSSADQVRRVLAAYNAGAGGVARGVRRGNVDSVTTSKNYGTQTAGFFNGFHLQALSLDPDVRCGATKCVCVDCTKAGDIRIGVQEDKMRVSAANRFKAEGVEAPAASAPKAAPKAENGAPIVINTTPAAKPTAAVARASAAPPSGRIIVASAGDLKPAWLKPHPDMDGLHHVEFSYVLLRGKDGNFILQNGVPKIARFGEVTLWDDKGAPNYQGLFYSGGEHTPQNYMNLSQALKTGTNAPAPAGLWGLGNSFHWTHIGHTKPDQFAMPLLKPGRDLLVSQLPKQLQSKVNGLVQAHNRSGVLNHNGPSPFLRLQAAAGKRSLTSMRAMQAELLLDGAKITSGALGGCSWSEGCLISADSVRQATDNLFKNAGVTGGGRMLMITYVDSLTGKRVDPMTMKFIEDPIASR